MSNGYTVDIRVIDIGLIINTPKKNYFFNYNDTKSIVSCFSSIKNKYDTFKLSTIDTDSNVYNNVFDDYTIDILNWLVTGFEDDLGIKACKESEPQYILDSLNLLTDSQYNSIVDY